MVPPAPILVPRIFTISSTEDVSYALKSVSLPPILGTVDSPTFHASAKHIMEAKLASFIPIDSPHPCISAITASVSRVSWVVVLYQLVFNVFRVIIGSLLKSTERLFPRI